MVSHAGIIGWDKKVPQGQKGNNGWKGQPRMHETIGSPIRNMKLNYEIELTSFSQENVPAAIMYCAVRNVNEDYRNGHFQYVVMIDCNTGRLFEIVECKWRSAPCRIPPNPIPSNQF